MLNATPNVSTRGWGILLRHDLQVPRSYVLKHRTSAPAPSTFTNLGARHTRSSERDVIYFHVLFTVNTERLHWILDVIIFDTISNSNSNPIGIGFSTLSPHLTWYRYSMVLSDVLGKSIQYCGWNDSLDFPLFDTIYDFTCSHTSHTISNDLHKIRL